MFELCIYQYYMIYLYFLGFVISAKKMIVENVKNSYVKLTLQRSLVMYS